MGRRRETQKRGRGGSGARSAPARRGARSHRRRRGGRRQTFARLALRECRGPGGGPPHASERDALARSPDAARPLPSAPLFGPAAPEHSESRPGRSPPPRGDSHSAAWLPPKGGVALPTKGPGLQVAPPRAAPGEWVTSGRRALARVWGMAGRCHRPGCGASAAAASPHPTYVSPTARLFWPTGFPEEVALGLPAHWARPSCTSHPSGRQCRARLDARFVCRTPGPRPPSRGGAGEGLVGCAAAWRRGAPTWSAGGWREAAEPGAGRLECARGLSRPAAGPGTARTCVSVPVRECVTQHSESTWERSTLYKNGRGDGSSSAPPGALSVFPYSVGKRDRLKGWLQGQHSLRSGTRGAAPAASCPIPRARYCECGCARRWQGASGGSGTPAR